MKIKYQKLSIADLHQLLINKTISPSDLINQVSKRLTKFNQLNAVVTNLIDSAQEQAIKLDQKDIKENNFLFAIPYVTKDNIATIGQKTTGSSKILADFIPNYDSTVNKLLKNQNGINIAKSALDELGMGGDGLYAATGYVYNPWDRTRVTGGSSSGSAALVAAGVVPFALGTDTGDSIRKPAAYCGIIGFKPTYGLISRNGVFPYAPSLDTVGVFTNSVLDAAIVTEQLAKYDENDFTSIKLPDYNFVKNLNNNVKGLKIAVLNYNYYQLDSCVKNAFDQTIKHLQLDGAIVEFVDFDPVLLNSLLPVYMMISFAEATSCHANLTGVNFASRIENEKDSYHEMMIKTRTAGFGNVVKRRYVIGSYVLSKEHQQELFVKAKKVRRVIVEKISELFTKFDAFLVLPSAKPAPLITEILDAHKIIHSEHKFMEDLLLLANLAGCPSITLPLTLANGLPIGINITTAAFNDQLSLNIAYYLSQKLNFCNKLLGEDHE